MQSSAFEKTSYGTKKLPFGEKDWRIPGYTGCIQGIQETYQKTPVQSQLETKAPGVESFIHTRTAIDYRSTPHRDPCNEPETFHKPLPDNLWPGLQQNAIQEETRLKRAFLQNGDDRIDPFRTSYGVCFGPAFERYARIRSPMRNPDLDKAATLKGYYLSSYNRIGESRLSKMISTMADRLAAKLGNSNDNGFKMRRLFKMYDKEQTGLIQIEDFRMMMESFGIQLDDDSLLALYHVYDPEGCGTIDYTALMSILLDHDYFAMYVDNVDNTLSKQEREKDAAMEAVIVSKFTRNIEDMLRVFKALDSDSCGSLSEHDFLAGCAALGVVLNDTELRHVKKIITTDAAGRIMYDEFANLFRKNE